MTRVLIVDDDPVQLRLTAEVARRAGFSPVTATGVTEKKAGPVRIAETTG